MATPPISLLNHHLLLRPIHKQQEERRNREKYAIHDPKRKCRLQHCTLLVDIEAERRVAIEAIGAKTDVERAVVGEA